jgi:hypothetical protein
MKLLSEVWMLVYKNDDGVIYEIGCSASDVWRKVIENETMGTGYTKEGLKKRGFKAKKVKIMLD